MTTVTTYTTSVPAISFETTGLNMPSESEILSGVQSDLNKAFGGNLSTSLSSPQGQLAQSLTAIIGSANDDFAYIVNQIDPTNASGSFQDALAKLYFLTRNAATSTTVTGTCAGVSGTVIPVGTYAQDTSGYTYKSLAAATIPSSGSVDVEFQCTTSGAITVAAGTLTKIVTAITGWDTITNASAGVTGTTEETQQEFEYRRVNSVSKNARSTTQAISANLYNVDGVTDVYIQANSSNSAVSYGSSSYSIPAHSVYIAVEGGTSSDIANAIWTAKDAASNTVGNTSYTIYDTDGYESPYPSYVINYNIPTQTPVYFSVKLFNNSNLPTDIISQVREAIYEVFYGSSTTARARIGSTLYTSRYYSAIMALSDYCNISSLSVGISASPTTPSYTMGIDQIPTLSTSNISVELV